MTAEQNNVHFPICGDFSQRDRLEFALNNARNRQIGLGSLSITAMRTVAFLAGEIVMELLIRINTHP
jgi:hypothetical protein